MGTLGRCSVWPHAKNKTGSDGDSSLWLCRRLDHRSEIQVLVIEAEVGEGRNRQHSEVVNSSIRFQCEGEECVLDGTIAPARPECVVLPVFQVANSFRCVVEGEYQFAILHANGRWPIPCVVINPGILLECQGRS